MRSTFSLCVWVCLYVRRYVYELINFWTCEKVDPLISINARVQVEMVLLLITSFFFKQKREQKGLAYIWDFFNHSFTWQVELFEVKWYNYTAHICMVVLSTSYGIRLQKLLLYWVKLTNLKLSLVLNFTFSVPVIYH